MSSRIRVIYARKPCDWHEIESGSRYGNGTAYDTEVIETREMTAAEYEEFIAHPLAYRDWLDDKGGWKNKTTRLAIAITSAGRETLYVDPSGYRYARYIGRQVADPSVMKFPEVRVSLTGKDGNAFNVLGLCKRAAYRAGVPDRDIADFVDEATQGDYNHLLATCQRWFDCY
jgi:hypothetical protein